MNEEKTIKQKAQADLLRGIFSWHNAHHLLLAAVIASCTLLLEKTGSLDWLDAVTLRLAASINNQSQPVDRNESPSAYPTEIPATLLIDDQLFESYFLQASPLSRGKMADLLNQIIEQSPKVLAIDIDLSPGADDPNGNSYGQVELDKQLDRAARSQCQTLGSHSADGCKVVLSLPFPVVSGKIQQLQLDWIKARCAAGIQFASAKLLSHQGTIIRQSVDAPNLGNVAAWVVSNHKADKHLSGHSSPAHPPYDYYCKNAFEYKSGKDFFTWTKLDPDANSIANTAPLNTNYFSLSPKGDANHIHLSEVIDNPLAPIFVIPDVSQRAVFLGGSYGVTDKYDTAVGNFDGVAIHAASFFGALNSVAVASHGFAWSLDILIGLMLGILFQHFWKQYNYAELQLKETELRPIHKKLSKYVKSKIWLLFNFFLLAILLWGFLYFSSQILLSGLWLNPGPIAIGMFIDSLLSSRSQVQTHHTASFKSMVKEHPDMLWQFALVLFVIISLTTAHH